MSNHNNALWISFFIITALVTYLGPGYFIPSLSSSYQVPIVDAPAGKFRGYKIYSEVNEREIFAYTGKYNFAIPRVSTIHN